MSKRITTRWYIGAWVVGAIAFVATIVLARQNPGTSPPPSVVVASLVAGVAGLVLLVMWIGALVKLGQQHSWGWFVAVLILQLIGLGIIGMVAYAAGGPQDEGHVALRPTAT